MMGRMYTEYFLPLLGAFGFKEFLKHKPEVSDDEVNNRASVRIICWTNFDDYSEFCGANVEIDTIPNIKDPRKELSPSK
jgi:hypothetical protein